MVGRFAGEGGVSKPKESGPPPRGLDGVFGVAQLDVAYGHRVGDAGRICTADPVDLVDSDTPHL